MPLSRHEALRALSRDHHVALQLARGLQAGASSHLRAQLPSAPAELVAHVKRVYTEELAGHFDAEDEVLAPAIAGKDPELDRLLSQIESDHASMAKTVAELSVGSGLEAALDDFGKVLEAHVRREEREYYPRIQEVLTEAEIEALGAALTRHLVYHGKKCDHAAGG